MKKTTLYITALLASAYSFAQLNVRNNAFVFVNDEVLFVTEEVNLQEPTANLYLRNESQLIQGATQSVPNTGQGRLSTLQEGDASNFTHNIWCSPVGNTTANSVGNRAFTPNENIYEVGTSTNPDLAPITSFPVNFIAGYDSYGNSTPQTATGSGDNLEIASYWFWKYLPGTTYADWLPVGDAGTVDAGYAFTMKGTDIAGQQYDFRGKPNSGTITTNVINDQYTMIGNPYPSALDTAAFIHDTNNLTTLNLGTLYFWEQQDTGSHVLTNYRAGYATYTITTGGMITYTAATMDSYNADGSFNTTGGAGSATKPSVLRYLPVGQGFMVNGGANGVITMRNSHRAYEKETGGNSVFFRTGEKNNNAKRTVENKNTPIAFNEEGLQIIPEDYKRFRINIDFNNTYARQLLHNFHDSATNELDYGLETRFPSPLASDIWFPRADDKLAANANKFDLDLKIPLHLVLDTEQPIRFRMFDIQNFEDNQPIYVHDKKLDIYHDLTISNHEINLPKGDYPSRFELTFKDNSREISLVESELDIFNIYQNNNTSTLNLINPRETNVSEISIHDVTGKRIFNSLQMNTQERFEISTRNLSEGVYVIKVDFLNGTSKSKKVIINQN